MKAAFVVFPVITAIPAIPGLEGMRNVFSVFSSPLGRSSNSLIDGMNPDYERNFPASWDEYPDEYEDNLLVRESEIHGPVGPCWTYLRHMSQVQWRTGEAEF